MSKRWGAYALHMLDAIAKIQRIQARGDITQDKILYDAILRNLQTLSEATQLLPDNKKPAFRPFPGAKSAALGIFSYITTWVTWIH